MGTRSSAFASRVASYEDEAASAATDESKMVFERWHSGRPIAPPRSGRPTTGGTFADLIKWEAAGSGLIEFDLAGLEGKAPYALVQEIGTGQTAAILNGGRAGSVSVSSQVGRTLPRSLYWGDSAGANPAQPMSGKNRTAQAKMTGAVGAQQLFERPAGSYGRAGRIRREIKGKHFIRDGGLAGYELLRDRLAADFNSTFK